MPDMGGVGRTVGGWVCWNWWRTIAVVLAVVLVLLGVRTLVANPSSQAATPAPRAAAASTNPPQVAPTVTVPAPATATEAVPGAPTVPAPRHLTVQAAAVAFTRAWVDTTNGKTAWLLAMTPYITPSLLGRFAIGDPGAVPASAVTGPPKIGERGGPGQVAVTVPTDTFPAELTMSQSNGAWLVSDINMNRTP